jgi:hypothetical protein
MKNVVLDLSREIQPERQGVYERIRHLDRGFRRNEASACQNLETDQEKLGLVFVVYSGRVVFCDL